MVTLKIQRKSVEIGKATALTKVGIRIENVLRSPIQWVGTDMLQNYVHSALLGATKAHKINKWGNTTKS